jgi:hypothetical protein
VARSPDRRHDRSLIAHIAVALLLAGLIVQAAFVVREAADELTTTPQHPTRELIEEFDGVMAEDASYAVAGGRAEYARYLLYPRRRVTAELTRAGLEGAGVRYVVVIGRTRPSALRGEQPWFRVLVDTDRGDLLELGP